MSLNPYFLGALGNALSQALFRKWFMEQQQQKQLEYLKQSLRIRQQMQEDLARRQFEPFQRYIDQITGMAQTAGQIPIQIPGTPGTELATTLSNVTPFGLPAPLVSQIKTAADPLSALKTALALQQAQYQQEYLKQRAEIFPLIEQMRLEQQRIAAEKNKALKELYEQRKEKMAKTPISTTKTKQIDYEKIQDNSVKAITTIISQVGKSVKSDLQKASTGILSEEEKTSFRESYINKVTANARFIREAEKYLRARFYGKAPEKYWRRLPAIIPDNEGNAFINPVLIINTIDGRAIRDAYLSSVTEQDFYSNLFMILAKKIKEKQKIDVPSNAQIPRPILEFLKEIYDHLKAYDPTLSASGGVF